MENPSSSSSNSSAGDSTTRVSSLDHQFNSASFDTPVELERPRSSSDTLFTRNHVSSEHDRTETKQQSANNDFYNETMALLPLVRCDTAPPVPLNNHAHVNRFLSVSFSNNPAAPPATASPTTSIKTLTPACSSNTLQQIQPYSPPAVDFERSSSTSPLFVRSPQPPPTPTSTAAGTMYENNADDHTRLVQWDSSDGNNAYGGIKQQPPQQKFFPRDNNTDSPSNSAGSGTVNKIAAHLLRPTIWLQNTLANSSNQNVRRNTGSRPAAGPQPENAPPLPRHRRRPSLTLSLTNSVTAAVNHQLHPHFASPPTTTLNNRFPLIRSPSGRMTRARRRGSTSGAQIDIEFVAHPTTMPSYSSCLTPHRNNATSSTFNVENTAIGSEFDNSPSPRASTCSGISQLSHVSSSSSDSVEHYSPVCTGPRPPYPLPQISVDDNMLTPLPPSTPNPSVMQQANGDVLIDMGTLAASNTTLRQIPALQAPTINIITSDSDKPQRRKSVAATAVAVAVAKESGKKKKKSKLPTKKHRNQQKQPKTRSTIVQIDPDSTISHTPATTATTIDTDTAVNGQLPPGNHVVYPVRDRRSHSLTFPTSSATTTVRSDFSGDSSPLEGGAVAMAARSAAAAALRPTDVALIPTNNHNFLQAPNGFSSIPSLLVASTLSVGAVPALSRTATMSSQHSVTDTHLSKLQRQNQRQHMLQQKAQKQHAKRYGRLVSKHGQCNTAHVNVRKRNRRFFADIFTTLVDMKWRYTMLLFTTGFFSSWLMFACIYFTIATRHGDFLPGNLGNPDWKPCVVQVESFGTAYLFSVETQHTIGYGHRYMTTDCAEAVIAMGCQAVLGVMIQSLLVGVVFAKLSRPKKRAQTLMFSKYAVVCERDNKMCLMFRVADMRRSLLVEAHVRAMVIRRHMTKEGEDIPYCTYDVNVGYDQGTDRIFMPWPQTIVHVIDRTSPFYTLSAAGLKYERFEMVVLLEGIVQSTGMTTQARTSYLPSEILWGHRFQKLVTYRKDEGEYKIDYNYFDRTTLIPGHPTCSARELRQAQRVQRALVKQQKQRECEREEEELNSASSSQNQLNNSHVKVTRRVVGTTTTSSASSPTTVTHSSFDAEEEEDEEESTHSANSSAAASSDDEERGSSATTTPADSSAEEDVKETNKTK